MNKNLVSTTFEIAGYEVIENLGLCRGVVVRSRSVVGNIGAAFQTVVGGNISIYTKLCEKTREEAFEILISHAQELGADGIVGIRYESNELAQGISEILCYGTAVKLKMK